MKTLLLALALSLTASAQEGFQPRPVALADLEIQVPPGATREIGYTNKESGVYYTETNGPHRSGWQGWRIMSMEMMESYGLTLGGAALRPADALGARAYPHRLVREYAGGVRETMTLLDSVDALLVELAHPAGVAVEARPFFSDAQRAGEFESGFAGGLLRIARKRHLARSAQENYPAWLGIIRAAGGGTSSMNNDPASDGAAFSPASLRVDRTDTLTVFLLLWGDSPGDLAERARRIAGDWAVRAHRRSARMERLLNDSYVRTNDARLDKALHWAKLSLDALVMNQVRKGIFAGLPWFDNYWGRDSFIALPGATLVTGQFAEAKEILRSFAAWQSADSLSPHFGRIPNLVTTASTSYNTADGTPRFILALDAYLRSSGDTSIVAEMYPVVKRSIEGTLRYHADSLSFLTHGDAETWMDAVGPSGAWSPRGDRANDVQALWSAQLGVGIRWAGMCGDEPSARDWTGRRSALRRNFLSLFVDTAHTVVYDHLNAGGSPDLQFRPNQLFTFGLLEESGAGELAAHLFDSLTRTLVYPHGVASLSQDDPSFHPYHHYAPYYVQDAAYHNGIVWTWLAGPWIDRALAYGLSDLAYAVTQQTVGQILDRGAIGTMSELLDAAPRPGEPEPRLSGTYSQAWSLAEFVRSFYEGYLGYSPDVPAGRAVFWPRLPRQISEAEFAVPFGGDTIRGSYRSIGPTNVVNIRSSTEVRAAARLRSFSGELLEGEFTVQPDVWFRAWAQESGLIVGSYLSTGDVQTVALPQPGAREGGGPRLARPNVKPDLEALRGPSHRVLTRAEVKRSDGRARVLVDAGDPEGDDAGPGTYTYPTTPSLKAGSLDVTRCRLASDSANLYVTLTFRNLSDPGWHPEYGFQLTYAALAIDADGVPGSGRREVGMNSGYVLPAERAAEKIVFVGGGVRVEDASGAVAAEYLPLPGDERDPLGSASRATISFSLPLELIGAPSKQWRFTLLVGAQDDHGGAGLGEFRAIGASAAEWSGGGKADSSGPNVYDTIIPP